MERKATVLRCFPLRLRARAIRVHPNPRGDMMFSRNFLPCLFSENNGFQRRNEIKVRAKTAARIVKAGMDSEDVEFEEGEDSEGDVAGDG
ncbi:MAG: hypothetical protein PHW56_08040, partial [Methanosarcinaceae archaeon]|nr:hypothetical protein [Methanosarcinaceae archaeon]